MAHLEVLLTRLEPLLMLLAAVVFYRSGSARKFPAVATYFTMQGSSWILTDWVICHGSIPKCGTWQYTAYFYTYWISYVACAVAIFFVLQEIFKRAMEPVPGLRRLGLIAFRWVSVVSFVVAVGAIALPQSAAAVRGDRIGPIALETMRCVSVMELCLLAFLALSIHALGRSFRSRLFGLGVGFGIQAATYLIGCALVQRNPQLTSGANLFVEAATAFSVVIWSAYFVVPEPAAERKLIVLPPNSMMARWNSLASGIGQTPEVSLAPATGFFLQDIENVVDRVLAKNPVIASR